MASQLSVWPYDSFLTRMIEINFANGEYILICLFRRHDHVDDQSDCRSVPQTVPVEPYKSERALSRSLEHLSEKQLIEKRAGENPEVSTCVIHFTFQPPPHPADRRVDFCSTRIESSSASIMLLSYHPGLDRSLDRP